MIVILYAAKTKLTPSHYRVVAWKGSVTHEDVWVRAVISKSRNQEIAFYQAKPRVGETVLRAIAL